MAGRKKGYRKPDEAYVKEYRTEIMLLSVMSLREVQELTGHSINTRRKLRRKFV